MKTPAHNIRLTESEARRLNAVAAAAGASPQRFAMNMILTGIRTYERQARIRRQIDTLRADGKSWAFIAARVHIPASKLHFVAR